MVAKRLAGKIAIITGAGSGIGRATSLLFAKEGAKVVLVDIDSKGGNETLHKIRLKGGDAIFLRTDVTKEDEIHLMLNQTLNIYKGVDILFNCAGAIMKPHNMPITDVPEEEWDRIINVNLKSVFLCSKNVFPLMKRKSGGNIINVSSIAALCLSPDIAPYTVAKAAVITLTKLFAIAGAPYNIRVNCVIPSEVDTPMLRKAWTERYGKYEPILSGPLSYRIGKPEEIAKVVLFLASDEASWVSGACVEVTGSRHLLKLRENY